MPYSQNNWKKLWLPAILLLLAVMAFFIDMPVARAFRNWGKSPTIGPVLAYINLFEVFGHGLGVLFILFAIYQLDPQRRWAIPRLLACAWGGGMLANLVKVIFVRARPYHDTLAGSVWSTFGDFFLTFQVGPAGQSFPSGHAATAAAFAVGLIWLYPQGKQLFTLLAVLVAMQRVISGAHFPSDVLAGAATGCLAAQFFLYIGLLPQWLSKFEQTKLGAPVEG